MTGDIWGRAQWLSFNWSLVWPGHWGLLEAPQVTLSCGQVCEAQPSPRGHRRLTDAQQSHAVPLPAADLVIYSALLSPQLPVGGNTPRPFQ